MVLRSLKVLFLGLQLHSSISKDNKDSNVKLTRKSTPALPRASLRVATFVVSG